MPSDGRNDGATHTQCSIVSLDFDSENAIFVITNLHCYYGNIFLTHL